MHPHATDRESRSRFPGNLSVEVSASWLSFRFRIRRIPNPWNPESSFRDSPSRRLGTFGTDARTYFRDRDGARLEIDTSPYERNKERTLYRCLACGARFPSHAPVCSWCWQGHSLVMAPDRQRAAIDAEPEMMTAKDLARTTYVSVDVPAYPDLVLKRGAMVVLVGPGGAGKSTMAARMLDSMQTTTLLLSVEEPAGPSVADRLARIGARDERMLVCSRASVDQVVGIVRKRSVAAIGIDSVQRASYEARELRHMLITIPALAFIVAVSQVNRDGDVRGGEELAHECDVLVEVQAMRWAIRKSRYQPTGVTGDVLDAAMIAAAKGVAPKPAEAPGPVGTP